MACLVELLDVGTISGYEVVHYTVAVAYVVHVRLEVLHGEQLVCQTLNRLMEFRVTGDDSSVL